MTDQNDLRERVARAMTAHHAIPWDEMPEMRMRRFLAYADAAIAALEPVTPSQIANFVRDAMICCSCDAVFDSVNNPHTDEDCTENNADWDIVHRDQLASELYAILTKEGQSDGNDN